MGCQSVVVLGANLTFSCCTHDPDTGELTDATGNVTYRIYEDDTDTVMTNGNMAKLDDANTTGFYVKKVAITTAAGFEVNKSYNIYIEATVDTVKGGITYGFTVDGSHTILRNKMAIVDATGAVTLYEDNSTTALWTGSVTDDSTTTTRTRLA